MTTNITKYILLGFALIAISMMVEKSFQITHIASAANSPTPVPGLIAYQGMLEDVNGEPVNGYIDIIFRIYDTSVGGSPLWTEEYNGENAVFVQNGLFQVHLGSLQPFPASLWDKSPLYLGIQIGNDEEMKPREIIGSAAWALKSSNSLHAETALFADQSNISSDIPEVINHSFKAPVLSAERTNSWGKIVIAGSSNNDQWNASGELTFVDRSYSPEHYYQLAFIEGGQFKFSYYDGDSWIWNAYLEGSTGNLRIRGSLSQGAIIERNLQTPEEQESNTISRFEQGDVLCWEPLTHRLERCSVQASPLVVAVADKYGKPIVLGAELIKVIGPVQPGDLLVASEVPGYAISWNQINANDSTKSPMGRIIAKALEESKQDRGIILAMILGR